MAGSGFRNKPLVDESHQNKAGASLRRGLQQLFDCNRFRGAVDTQVAQPTVRVVPSKQGERKEDCPPH